LLHELLEASQKSPVAAVQAEAPQTQGAGLFALPPPCSQAGPVKPPTTKLLEVLHWLRGLWQKSPVVAAAQSVVPQVQFSALACCPSAFEHEMNRWQLLPEAWQKKPVAVLQSAVPHAQLLSLDALPSVVAHVPKRHRLSFAKQKGPLFST